MCERRTRNRPPGGCENARDHGALMKPYRRQKLGSAIRTIVSDTILHRLNDPRISPMTTVTRVEVSKDLLIAKVYLSILGTESEERKSFDAIQHAAGHIQRNVADELSIRHCPQIRFLMDESMKMARRTLAILAENRMKNPSLVDPDEEFELEDVESVRSQGYADETDQPAEEADAAAEDGLREGDAPSS